jgi:ribosomal peptide maturation radical SAM protein 1
VTVKTPASEKRVLLILPPFANPEFPGLGPALLRSILNREGIATDILYANLLFSKVIEGDPFIERQLIQVPACEMAFTPHYFGTDRRAAAECLRTHVIALAKDPDSHSIERYLRIVDLCGDFLDAFLQSVDWNCYDVVGFSVMVGQTVSALAISKRIKELQLPCRIVFGGPNTLGPPGRELIRSFPEIDFVLQGEADETFSRLVERIRSSTYAIDDIPGLIFRNERNEVSCPLPHSPVQNLDSLPIPDLQPFFDQLDSFDIHHIQPYMPLETARGCWWGAKHHCTFCGIEDNIMKFRSKSPQRALDEILALSERHNYTEFAVVDSIINLKYFRDLLPQIGRLREEQEWDFSFFFETKSNLTREHARLFHYAGVSTVQPGLESFSDHILRLMKKGTTAARQIQCLKFLAEHEIVATWNVIFGIPGEVPADYDEMIAVIPFLHHIPPCRHATWLTPMLVNRFAPYHSDPTSYGIRNIRPSSFYRDVFPRPDIDLDSLATYFDYDRDDAHAAELKVLHASLRDSLKRWQACYQPDSLMQIRGPNFVRIVDRRVYDESLLSSEAPASTTVLTGTLAEIFVYCDEIRQLDEIQRRFSSSLTEEEVRAFLAGMHRDRLIYCSPSGQVISLPLLKESQCSAIAPATPSSPTALTSLPNSRGALLSLPVV